DFILVPGVAANSTVGNLVNLAMPLLGGVIGMMSGAEGGGMWGLIIGLVVAAISAAMGGGEMFANMFGMGNNVERTNTPALEPTVTINQPGQGQSPQVSPFVGPPAPEPAAGIENARSFMQGLNAATGAYMRLGASPGTVEVPLPAGGDANAIIANLNTIRN